MLTNIIPPVCMLNGVFAVLHFTLFIVCNTLVFEKESRLKRAKQQAIQNENGSFRQLIYVIQFSKCKAK